MENGLRWINSLEPAEEVLSPPEALLQGIGVPVTYVGKNRLDYIVEVTDEETLQHLKPNAELLISAGSRGVIVTSRSK